MTSEVSYWPLCCNGMFKRLLSLQVNTIQQSHYTRSYSRVRRPRLPTSSNSNKLVIPKPPPKLRVYKPPGSAGLISHHQVTQLVPSTPVKGHRPLQSTAHRRHDHGRSADVTSTPSGGGDSFFRSLMGVKDYCLPGIEGDLEAECVFGPLCWLSGGVPHSGCNSLLYTCCVPMELARKVRNHFTIATI